MLRGIPSEDSPGRATAADFFNDTLTDCYLNGKALFESGDCDGALKILENAVRLRDCFGDIQCLFGKIVEEVGCFEGNNASYYFERALIADPKNIEAMAHLVIAEGDPRSQMERFIGLILTASSLNSSSAQGQNIEVTTLQLDKVIALVRNLKDDDPNKPFALIVAAYLMPSVNGRISLIREAVTYRPGDAWFLGVLGECSFRLAHSVQHVLIAAQLCQESLRLRPKAIRSRRLLASIYNLIRKVTVSMKPQLDWDVLIEDEQDVHLTLSLVRWHFRKFDLVL